MQAGNAHALRNLEMRLNSEQHQKLLPLLREQRYQSILGTAWHYRLQGRRKEAIKTYRAAIALRPQPACVGRPDARTASIERIAILSFSQYIRGFCRVNLQTTTCCLDTVNGSGEGAMVVEKTCYRDLFGSQSRATGSRQAGRSRVLKKFSWSCVADKTGTQVNGVEHC